MLILSYCFMKKVKVLFITLLFLKIQDPVKIDISILDFYIWPAIYKNIINRHNTFPQIFTA